MKLAELAALRPDTPQWVDLRGFLLGGGCAIFSNPDPTSGFIVSPDAYPVSAVAGQPEPEVLRRAIDAVAPERRAAWHLLVPDESLEGVRRELNGWRTRGVLLHALAGSFRPSPVDLPAGFDLRVAPGGWGAAGWKLAGLPEDLREEYGSVWVRQRPVAAAWQESRPAAFCYSAVETERLWDVAVDTLPEFRRRGLSIACFHALAGSLAERGRQPVWGALESNEASCRLAARLGFRPAARLTSFLR